MIALYLETIKLTGWILAIILMFIFKKGVPLGVFYLMLLSCVLMCYAGIEDLMHPYILATKSLAWTPANLVIIAAYITTIIRYHKDYMKIKKTIRKWR